LVEATIRTAPVELLMQAEIFVDAGAARTGATARSEAARMPRHLREDIETSEIGCCAWNRERYA
jgi:hypothetical protein